MFNDFYEIASELKAQGEPFVAVTVVRNEAPSSGKTGDKAIVSKDGVLRGWVGGGCVYSIMMKEVNEALQDGKPRFVRVSPSDTEGVSITGIKTYPMTCHSGGAIDLYIEPVLPKPHLIIIGKSIFGRALMHIAKAADYRITVVANDATPDVFPQADTLRTDFDLTDMVFDGSTFIVVATQGDNDEKAIETALSVTCRYVGFISSLKKREAVFKNLETKGYSEKRLKEIHAPAGIDINGKTPEEVAISILAEIIQEFRTKEFIKEVKQDKPVKFALDIIGQNTEGGKTETPVMPQIVTNPVCGMPISKGMAKYTIEYDGKPIYFCCDGCKIKFDDNPKKYIDNPVPEGTGM